MDLSELFTVHVSPLELIVRGTVMYWFLLLIFRFVLRRDAGSLGVADILLVVVIADASQNAMAGGYGTVTEGFVLVGTLVFWNYALDWAACRWDIVHKLTDPPPLQMIRAGRPVLRNMRKEFVTREDLDAQLRQAGIDDIRQVRSAYLEGDGKFSVLKYDDRGDEPRRNDGGLPGA
jgi:uncharacterized membrane protein YcaP (DUF421 family)